MLIAVFADHIMLIVCASTGRCDRYRRTAATWSEANLAVHFLMGVVHVPEKQSYDVHRHHTLRMNIVSVYTKLKTAVNYHQHRRR